MNLCGTINQSNAYNSLYIYQSVCLSVCLSDIDIYIYIYRERERERDRERDRRKADKQICRRGERD